ncbi:MAG: hypothetical protein PWP74_2212 [Shewanella sp.]|nr:hypothetical protein [Shewanella sp.]
MIFSLILRSFKTYSRQTYIPISDGTYFSALIGENGIGKSAVLEALDTFFNKYQSEWNINHAAAEKGVQEREPTICLICVIKRTEVQRRSNLYKYLEEFSDITWQIEKDDFNSSQYKIATAFCEHRENFKSFNKDCEKDYFMFPVGINLTSLRPRVIENSISIFGHIEDYENRILDLDIKDPSLDDALEQIRNFVLDKYEYIYIPSDIDFITYTKLESKTIQSLMGETVENIIKSNIDPEFIKKTNRQLEELLNEISNNLEKYVYKKPGKRQTLFNESHISSKIIETYFESKILNLKTGNNLTPIYNLSSGEKRMALIDIANAFLTKDDLNKGNKEVIFAIDEPEISLHISTCFQQFEKIKSISKNKIQTIITTHWYGFMPIISDGSAIYLADNDEEKICSIINLKCYLDDFKKLKLKTTGYLPKEIELKGHSDLIQSIVASITSSKSNWIICEGSSDKIYIDHFLSEREKYVIPIGKSKNVKKIFEYLYLALGEDRDSILGKVFLLLDTDKKFEQYSTPKTFERIRIKRLLNKVLDKKTYLEDTNSNMAYPPTEIEDALCGEVFLKTLEYFHENGYEIELKNVMNGISIKYEETASGMAFDFPESKKSELESFFDIPGIKIMFALKYCELDFELTKPHWISELEAFLY